MVRKLCLEEYGNSGLSLSLTPLLRPKVLSITLTTAVCGSTIRMTTWACSKAYANCGFSNNIWRASFGSFCMQAFICFISSYICSGGSEATVLVIISGAWSGSQCSPYGFSTCGPCNSCCISMRDFSVQALSTRNVRPPIS